jgi:hypothetical protein
MTRSSASERTLSGRDRGGHGRSAGAAGLTRIELAGR